MSVENNWNEPGVCGAPEVLSAVRSTDERLSVVRMRAALPPRAPCAAFIVVSRENSFVVVCK